MAEFWEILHREAVYILYYFDVQFRQIFGYYMLGIVIGSCISVFLKDRIHGLFRRMGQSKFGALGWIFASLLGIASPLCMYGTIPLAASIEKSGMRQDWLGAFMMTSILLNPQLIIYSAALGTKALVVRILSAFFCGIFAGVLLWVFFRGADFEDGGGGKSRGADKGVSGGKLRGAFFDFSGFDDDGNGALKSRDTDPNVFLRLLKNIGRNIRATAPMFLLGIFLSALFQRYVPSDVMVNIFGGNEAWGVLMAATIGVPLYACGGGTIPLIQQWLSDGMSLGSAAAFMITGPATKITNLGALKIVLGVKHFFMYLLFVMTFAFLTGVVVNVVA